MSSRSRALLLVLGLVLTECGWIMMSAPPASDNLLDATGGPMLRHVTADAAAREVITDAQVTEMVEAFAPDADVHDVRRRLAEQLPGSRSVERRNYQTRAILTRAVSTRYAGGAAMMIAGLALFAFALPATRRRIEDQNTDQRSGDRLGSPGRRG